VTLLNSPQSDTIQFALILLLFSIGFLLVELANARNERKDNLSSEDNNLNIGDRDDLNDVNKSKKDSSDRHNNTWESDVLI